MRVLRVTVQKQKKAEAKKQAEKVKLEDAYNAKGEGQPSTIQFLSHLRESEDYLLKLAVGESKDQDTKDPRSVYVRLS